MVQSWQIFLCAIDCQIFVQLSVTGDWRYQSQLSGVGSTLSVEGGGARLIKNLGKQNRKRALNMVMCNFAKKGATPPLPSSPFPCSDAYAVTTGHILPRLVNIRLYRWQYRSCLRDLVLYVNRELSFSRRASVNLYHTPCFQNTEQQFPSFDSLLWYQTVSRS